MPSHDCHDPFHVRWPTRINHFGDLTEILGAEQPRGDHAEHPSVLSVEVLELMHASAWNEKDVGRSDGHLLAVEHPGRDAVQAVDGLIEGFMAVRHWQPGPRG